MTTQQVKEIDRGEMPRERMERLGAAALSDNELVAILLRTGYKNKSVFELAHELTANNRLYRELAHMNTVAEIQTIKGLGGLSKSTTLLAAIELGNRIARHRISGDEKTVINRPKDVYDFLGPELRYENIEHFYVLLLNNRSQLITYREVSSGTLTGSLVHQREVYKLALIHNAAKIIAVHNHPSGDPSPSRDDRNITKILREAGEMMGIHLIDHVIIGDGEYYSFSDNNIL